MTLNQEPNREFKQKCSRKLYRQGSRGIKGITGSLLFVENMTGVGCGELVTLWGDPVNASSLEEFAKTGQVLQVKDDLCVVQMFDDAPGLETGRATVWMERDVAKVGVGEALRGRILNGRGLPADGRSLYGLEEFLPAKGLPPGLRIPPNGAIETGISALDLMNTWVRGQRLSLLGGPGLPAGEIAARMAARALIPGKDGDFLVIFAAMGVTGREADLFIETFERDGVTDRSVLVLNKANDPVAERLLAPRVALTVAEYFAFVKGYDVLVVMADMLHYCDALREISALRKEIPGRGGYPVAMYSDLAELYERSGCIAGCPGSVTQLSVITAPDDDVTHPVADLSGQLLDGQIVLDRELHAKGIFPPFNVQASLSRSMDRGIGRGKTFDSHRVLADQLRSAYVKARETRLLRAAVGDAGLSEVGKLYLKFGDAFEKFFVGQKGRERQLERRTLAQSEAKAWEVLSELPVEELSCLPQTLLERKIAIGAASPEKSGEPEKK
ncbi:MAG: V-type ATP synthase subunit B [Synergistaceae bacterium]|jgi:V/A-type H+-transporting ATPase subunit B|nr:V-type ATP synthase subunit B [Synergistaceae bacterium]